MPIFIDRHDLSGVSAADIAAAHLKDPNVQEQYGVRFLTYWFDERRGTAFWAVATMALETTSGISRATSTCLRSKRAANPSVIGAAITVKKPGTVTISPAVPSLIPRSVAISGRRPTGRNSVVTRAKAPIPTLATAAQDASGLLSACAEGSFGRLACPWAVSFGGKQGEPAKGRFACDISPELDEVEGG